MLCYKAIVLTLKWRMRVSTQSRCITKKKKKGEGWDIVYYTLSMPDEKNGLQCTIMSVCYKWLGCITKHCALQNRNVYVVVIVWHRETILIQCAVRCNQCALHTKLWVLQSNSCACAKRIMCIAKWFWRVCITMALRCIRNEQCVLPSSQCVVQTNSV